jgi:KTSC domain
MNRIPVSSSNIASVGYDPATQLLEVEFLHGGIYQYSSVHSSIYDTLMAGDFRDTYFDQYVKKAGYSYQKTC